MVFSAQFHAPRMIHQIQHRELPPPATPIRQWLAHSFSGALWAQASGAVCVTVGDHIHARAAARSVDQRSAHLSCWPDCTSGRSAHHRPRRFRCPTSCRRIDPRAASPVGVVACVRHARGWRHQGRSYSLVFSAGAGDRVGQGRSCGIITGGMASRGRRLALARLAGSRLSPCNAGHDGRPQPVDDRAVDSYPSGRG